MSMTVTIANEGNLQKLKQFFGAKDENETVEIVIEKTLREIEKNQASGDLPDNFFDELFNEETTLSDSESIKKILEEREESRY